ncbi:fucolectin-like [Cottoperca gobio]|uniref:Fucolectin-like n=1 Tax=Cottoperca gobio TaxID=56716 RepID=A0A6J2R8E0_COTGO|nr:fucolectin-like [Cottoperca gobio]
MNLLHRMKNLAVVFVLLAVLGQTCGSGSNLALFGKASQSSTYYGASPQRAIDGNTEGTYGKGSCSCTRRQTNPWWRVDLGKTYKIDTVTITNRKDCCSGRLNGAEIHIGDTLVASGNANPRCAVIRSIGPRKSKTFKCNGMEGRYVNIVIPRKRRYQYLTLCEVEVTGTASEETDEYACN